MKAHINGITFEGTPQEIMEYQRLQTQLKPMNPFTPWYGQHKQDELTREYLRRRSSSGSPPPQMTDTTCLTRRVEAV